MDGNKPDTIGSITAVPTPPIATLDWEQMSTERIYMLVAAGIGMAPEDRVDHLVENGVFELSPGGAVRLSKRAVESIDRWRSEIQSAADDQIRDTMSELIGDTVRARLLCERTEYDTDLLSRYFALSEFDDTLAPMQMLTLSILIGQLEDGVPPAGGAPDGFIPVGGDDLVTLVSSCRRAVVYVWREDCDPCDTVRRDLEEIVIDYDIEDIHLLAVYGPDDKNLLNQQYNVVGAPTTLFTTNGTVDSRFVGVPLRDALESEIETLHDRTFD
ncbi:MAG: thioredoxin family protein [Halobacteriota archaeon]